MLVLTRKSGERIRVKLGDVEVWITCLGTHHGHIRLGIEAPVDVHVARAELLPGHEPLRKEVPHDR